MLKLNSHEENKDLALCFLVFFLLSWTEMALVSSEAV